MEDVDIFVIRDKDAEDYKRKSINKLATNVRQFFDNRIMENTLEAMAEKALPGEPEGNCHMIALGFMVDLIIAKQAKGWVWVKGLNANQKVHGKAWEHSWIEYDGFAIDATVKQKENQNKLTISIGEVGYYYKARGITKVVKRRNAKQTQKWIFKHGGR